ncbi:hypothetical protein V7S43_015336 [Phytophthora oleae]|uniref:Uncharacterized protein n=1 Tax=Phytophthora oleae TaxID=2107226 RepID=A0ABD3EZF7_9STRA
MPKLRQSSYNANFLSTFGTSAVLPATDGTCTSYEDPLAAVSGLIAVGDALWYDHARLLLSRLKRFVLANLARDSSNTPEHVTLTMLHVNQFLDRPLAHLLLDSPHWWRDFCGAVRAVDYNCLEWQATLNSLAHQMATSSKMAGQSPAIFRQSTASSRRGSTSRFPVMPGEIRRLIPRGDNGREPCLRFMSGGMCYGGSVEQCAHARRTHRWNGRRPHELQEWIDRHYFADRRLQTRRQCQ